MIIYFSSTGNSKYVAKVICKKYGDELFDIGKSYNSINTFNLKENEILFPITFNCFWICLIK